MELQCDMCSLQFDLDNHRPKVVPCGHSICQTCAQNPALKRKCPAACTTDLTANPSAFPDNILAIRMIMERDGAKSRKRPRLEDAKLQHLRRGVDAGRELVRQLQQLVPRAVAALNCQMNSALAHLRELEEALEKHQREGAGAEASPTPDEVQLVVQLEDSVRLLSSSACSVVAEQGVDSWRASVTLFPFHHVLRLLLLQLRAGGQLQRVEVIVGPPTLTTLVIPNGDVDARSILRNESRWKSVRTLTNVNGRRTEQLLRIVAPHLEELEISDVAEPSVMGEVKRITSLKRLLVRCSPDYDCFDYPDLPLQLEELAISCPSFYQLRSVQLMSRLRSLKIRRYTGAPVIFLRQQHGGLLWLGLDCRKTTQAATFPIWARTWRPAVSWPCGASFLPGRSLTTRARRPTCACSSDGLSESTCPLWKWSATRVTNLVV
ncbi:uncharacterized protein LOC113217095 isoform X2 [Frankliniella occidentalis]|uniref:Uncharacterized protein LOC113217095 isoform X2 n=1 Tax=Frankliniella occidentalis TaxID=133901 RepID=A0A9C6UBD7_FRAOC|nr:uncharacterized protein LOC113217095 isoform X2 [Frankliniella occidentalis]